MTCEKRGAALPRQPRRGPNPRWVAAAGLLDLQCISMSASAPFTAEPAAWLDSTAPFPSACVKGMRVAVFAQVMAVVYLLCHSFFGLVADFLSQLSQCALTQPCAACVRHNQVCLPLGSQLSCHAQLLLGWCLPRQGMVPSFPAQTMDVPSNVSSGMSSTGTERGTERQTRYFTPVALQKYLGT